MHCISDFIALYVPVVPVIAAGAARDGVAVAVAAVAFPRALLLLVSSAAGGAEAGCRAGVPFAPLVRRAVLVVMTAVVMRRRRLVVMHLVLLLRVDSPALGVGAQRRGRRRRRSRRG